MWADVGDRSDIWTPSSIVVTIEISTVSAAPPLPPRPQALPSGASDGSVSGEVPSAGATSESAAPERPTSGERLSAEAARVDPDAFASSRLDDGADDDELLFEAGKVLAKKYLLERPAGFGGMAQLWVATNQATGAEVCVKLLIPSGEDRGEAVERFRREAHAAAMLSHRAIVRVFDLLELDENGETTKDAARAYAIVMELLHGETLGDCLAKRGAIPLDEALDLFLPIVSALAHAHRAAVIHRDIKPDNIFLSREPDGQIIPKVLDFGVSKLSNAEAITIDGVLVGTPCFMSPEQAKGVRQLDARSDVFSAGILFYTMLTGRNPFEDAPTFAAVVEAVLRKQVRPIDGVSEEIWAVIERSTGKDPAARFADATEMSIALRKASGRKAITESNPALPIALLPRAETRSFEAAAEADSLSSTESSSTPPQTVAARRRQAIVAAIVGVSAGLIVTAAAITILSKASSGGTGPATTPAQTLTALPKAAAASAAPVPNLPTSFTHPSATTETMASSDPVKPVATNAPAVKAPPSSPTHAAHDAPVKRQPAPSSMRKPGQEPQKARDPGF